MARPNTVFSSTRTVFTEFSGFFTILGNVSPGAKSSRCLLEDLQQLIHWISGKTPKEFNNAPKYCDYTSRIKN